MIDGINHIGLAVRSIDDTVAKWRAFMAVEEIGRAEYPDMGQTSALIRLGESSYFELMEPLGEKGVVYEFLMKNGEGFHHVSLHSQALESDCAAMAASGVKILGDSRGPIVFAHPRSMNGLLCEINECGNAKVDI